MHFEFLFNLIRKSTKGFLTGQSWNILKSGYTGRDPEQGFWCGFADGLTRSLVPSVVQGIIFDAVYEMLRCKNL